jgi:hypothetical protein
MKNRIPWLTALLALPLLFALGLAPWQAPEAPFTGHGDPASLGAAYQRWKTAHEAGGAEILRLDLRPSQALSRASADAQGKAALNLADGRLRIEAAGLPEAVGYEAWLLDRHAAGGSKSIRLGALAGKDGQLSLDTALDRELLAGFTLDAVAIVQAGAAPEAGAALKGTPGLFHRLYYADRAWTFAQVAAPGGAPAPTAALAFEFLLPKAAHAQGRRPASGQPALEALIARGREIFVKETFGGNGRTCATCHRLDNNHAIDAKYIATLPPDDPLFVAETDPALAGLENPALLRQFGLIAANIDGFDRPPVMRGVPHLLALATSLTFETKDRGGEFQEDSDYFNARGGQAQAVGWSQDGAPDGGSLRDFAKGAVRQHLPRSLNRIEGADFRLPTEDELDALEAYLLSLGRDAEVILASLHFKSPLVEKGKLLFDQKQNPLDAGGNPVFGQSANCNGCHMNAGAMSSTTGANPTRDTGVARQRDLLYRLADPSVAYDGGFGQAEQADCGPDSDAVCYSDGSADPRSGRHQHRFNTTTLIEAADTGPFFHDNSVFSLEEAVAFYNTDAFNHSPGAFTSSGKNRQVRIDSSQVQAVALFLRYLNVLENIRSANQLAAKAMALRREQAREMARLALADTQDAIEVIREAGVVPHPDALARLELALQYEERAASTASDSKRNGLLQNAIASQNQARSLIVEP